LAQKQPKACRKTAYGASQKTMPRRYMEIAYKRIKLLSLRFSAVGEPGVQIDRHLGSKAIFRRNS
jgi:hypothetical protein